MFFKKKKTLIAKNAKIEPQGDPMAGFKRPQRGEMSRYHVKGEIGKSLKKIGLLALLLLWFYFLKECYNAWNIFQ